MQTRLLPADQSHHLRDVLRMRAGESIELFSSQGVTADAVLESLSADAVCVRVTSLRNAPTDPFKLTVASAVPRSNRADWMIEKLSELGAHRFIPLSADRSVVLPEGQNKLDRWRRIAIESAKQSRRPGAMVIDPLCTVADVIQRLGATDDIAWLSTASDATPIGSFVADRHGARPVTLLVGPEGDWSPAEIAGFSSQGLTAIALTATILRVETAAMAAAAIFTCLQRSVQPEPERE